MAMLRPAAAVRDVLRRQVRGVHPGRVARAQQQQQPPRAQQGTAALRVEDRRRERDGLPGKTLKSPALQRNPMQPRVAKEAPRPPPVEALAVFVGWAEWTRDGRHPHSVQDKAMDDACHLRYGAGVRAATWNEYHHNLVQDCPDTNQSDLWLHFTGKEGWGYDNGKGYQWKKCVWRKKPLNGGFTEDSCSARYGPVIPHPAPTPTRHGAASVPVRRGNGVPAWK